MMKNNKKSVIFLALIFVFQLIVPAFCLTYERNKQNELDENGEEYKIVIDFAHFDNGAIRFSADEFRTAIDSTAYDIEDGFVVFEEDKYGIGYCTVTETVPSSSSYISLRKFKTLYYEDLCTSFESSVTRNVKIDGNWKMLYEREVIEDVTDKNLDEYSYAVVKVYKNRIKVTNLVIHGVPIDLYIKRVQADDEKAHLDYYETEDYEIM